MYIRSPHLCGKVLYNVCIKVYFCGKVCVYVLINDDLNVL
jgi:hypothetical protein